MAADEDKIITFETYYDPILAHIVRTRLEDNGINCFIADENTIGMNPLYNNALGGIKLKIFARDEEECRLILAQDEDLATDEHGEPDHEINPTVVCPYCGSANVRYGDATEKRFDLLSKIIAFLSFTLPFYSKKAWHCFNCSRDFE